MRESFSSTRPMLPSACATARSRNSSVILLCMTEKPSRQALCARAHPSQVFPRPVAPSSRTFWCWRTHSLAGQRSHQLAVEVTRVLVINVFDDAALLQTGGVEDGAPARDFLSRATADRRACQNALRIRAGSCRWFPGERERHRPFRAVSWRAVFRWSVDSTFDFLSGFGY